MNHELLRPAATDITDDKCNSSSRWSILLLLQSPDTNYISRDSIRQLSVCDRSDNGKPEDEAWYERFASESNSENEQDALIDAHIGKVMTKADEMKWWRVLRLRLSHFPLLSYVTSFVLVPTTYVVAY